MLKLISPSLIYLQKIILLQTRNHDIWQSSSISTGSIRRVMKEVPIWEYVKIEKYTCSIFHNHINMGDKDLYKLLNYGNDYIEKITIREKIARDPI